MSSVPRGERLFDNRPFLRLWLSRSISHIGDGVALIALVLYVKQLKGSGVAVGTLLVAQALPHLAGPFAGVLADRVDIRRLMIGSELGQALVFIVVALWQPPYAALLLLVVAASLLDTSFGPAAASATPALVEAPGLMQANAWLGTSLNLQIALGPVIGGLLVTSFGVRWALLVNALSFVISAVLLAGLPARLRALTADPAGVLSSGIEGLRFAWRRPAVRALIGGVFFMVAFAAVDNVALVFLTRDVLHTSAFGFGLVAGAFGIGMLAGSLALSTIGRRPRSASLLVVAWGFTSAGTAATGLAPNAGVAAVTQAVGGLGNGVENAAATTLIQEIVPGPMLGRVFSLFSTAAFAGSTVAYLLAGFLLDATNPRVTFVAGGAGALLTLLASGPVIWRAARGDQR